MAALVRGLRRLPPSLLAAIIALALGAGPVSAAIVTNGDFETGDFTGWAAFTTSKGTANAGGPPDVVSFDTTGKGASKAAHLNVGQATLNGNVAEGGGIFQQVNLVPGNYVFSTDLAMHMPADNDQCGDFRFMLDGSTFSEVSFGLCNKDETRRFSTSAHSLQVAQAGQHELRIVVVRAHQALAGVTPDQYLDNVALTKEMQLTCSPGAVVLGASTTCTVTELGDAGALGHTAPTGAVSFSSGSNASGPDGLFTPGGCTLVATSATSASCSITYKPTQVDSGTHAITARYGGDSAYRADTSGASVSVSAPVAAGPAAAAAAAAISGASESNRTFRAATRSQLVQVARRRAPVGTTFRFTLDKPAAVRLDFVQRLRGRKLRGRCAAPTKRNRRRPRCGRSVAVGSLGFAGHAGVNTVRFLGWLSRTKKLTPGQYTLVINAITAGAASTSHTLKFAIVR